MRHRGGVMRAWGRARLIDGDPCRQWPWVAPKGGPNKPTARRRTVRADARGAPGSGGALAVVDEAAQDVHLMITAQALGDPGHRRWALGRLAAGARIGRGVPGLVDAAHQR